MTRIEEINEQIEKLALELKSLVSPTEEEMDMAIEMLTDDPYNDVQAIVDPEDSLGLIMILQQVLDDRVYEEEERDESLDAGTTQTD